MSDKSSGTYIIDEDYNIISANQTVLDLYPSVQIGKKCYKCLMNLEEPCPPCPVANHIQGPQTYMDPIRKIYETVDAVEVPLPDGTMGHALVMSTVGEGEAVSARLPRSRDELNRLLEQKYFDTLTEGYTRKGFIRECERLFSRNSRTNYAMILFDIQNFKAINETFGSEDGDQVINYVFTSLCDSWLKPLISARIESDHFLFLVQRDRIQKGKFDSLLNLEWYRDGRNVHLHLHSGIYYVEDCQASVSRMVDWTILARQYAERGHHESCAVFEPSMREQYIDQAEIVSSFTNSLRDEEFQVWYQPIIDAASGKVCAAEALVRWNHPKQGFIGPDRFIPALEAGGFITRLDLYVLKHVQRFQHALYAEKMPVVPVSVNLSRQDFYSDSFLNEIFSLAQTCPLPKSCINYEVTETAVAVLRENCEYLFQQLRQIGAKVLLDDFGSGYSSLAMIGNYSFDVVKIDKSLISQIETKSAVRAVIESTISMCHNIGLYTVAEGVENSAQLDFLKNSGCDCIQGYYYSRPMPEKDFREFLSTSQIAESCYSSVKTRKRPKGFDIDDIMDLVNHSGQFIQVCRPEDYSMVYANEMTLDISGHPDLPYEGERCYHYMLGLDAPCGHCPMKFMNGEEEKEIEVDDGSRIFSLKARYTTWNGKRVFIEYGRDITDTKAGQRRYADQIRGILENIPEGQGVFHMDLTADKWISSGGSAQNARDMQDLPDVNTLIRQIGSFVPDKEGQDRFFRTFSRDAQLRAYAVNKRQIVLETESYYDDKSIRWSRITAHIIENPNTDHVESIIYGVDISREQTHIEELEKVRRQDRAEKEALRQKIDETLKMYTQADRDRRYDYLTGLYNRLALYQFIRNDQKRITGALMLDIDNFKRINDSYGHAAGDECLKELGRMLMEFSVHRDIFFFRFGGEEIVGLMQKDDADIGAVSSELLEEIREKKIPVNAEKEISVTVSIGYTAVQNECREMISQADRAMYVAKKQGKDQIACLD